MPNQNRPRLPSSEFAKRVAIVAGIALLAAALAAFLWIVSQAVLVFFAAGLFGVLIAAPMMVTLTVIVQMLYVEDVLGDSAHILGD